MNIKDNEFFTNQKSQYKDKNIGDFTYGSPILQWWTPACRVGKFCSIAGGVTIFGGGNHRTDWVSTYPFNALANIFGFGHDITGHPASKGPTVLENDIWIGEGATIMSGVHVGNGAVIAARACVAKNVPPYSIVAGNPAHVIKMRFSPAVINELLNICWWDMDIGIIGKYVHLIQSDNIELFINAIKNK